MKYWKGVKCWQLEIFTLNCQYLFYQAIKYFNISTCNICQCISHQNIFVPCCQILFLPIIRLDSNLVLLSMMSIFSMMSTTKIIILVI